MSKLHLLLLGSVLLGACKQDEGPAQPVVGTVLVSPPKQVIAPLEPAKARAMFAALPARFDSPAQPSTDERIALGRMLYYDARLSKNHDLSCNSCHDLAAGGVDNQRFSTGHKGQLGGRNSPTVFNAAGQFVQFWDGRAADVEAQAKGPILNPVEMAMADEAAVLRVVSSIPGYVKAFAAAFPGEREPLTYDNLGRAIGAFERGLVTPSPFDAFVAGDDAALTAEQQGGLAAFVGAGCTACHTGTLLGGTSYQKVGVTEPYPSTDEGRMAVTHNEAERSMFKVPMLRNVTATAPYFHDGAIADLPTAVRTMARIQLGRTLTDDEVAAIVAFLGSLEGRPDPSYIARPPLPPSGQATPAPDPA